jgi:hypothetical protein
MADETQTQQTTTQQTTTASGDTKDAAYWEAEAKKAFRDRDTFKQKARDLEGRQLTDEQAERFKQLEEREAKAEEERKRKAGEFDAWRQTITEKHTKELQERESKLTTIAQRFQDTVKRAEFGAATDYFGGHDQSKTILDVDLAMAFLGKYIAVEDTDEGGFRVTVKTPQGHTILGKDGNPAPFADAIGELIAALPNKERILRGSGKTGSGNSGGGSANQPADLAELTKRAQAGDKDAVAKLRARSAASGRLQMGSALQAR